MIWPPHNHEQTSLKAQRCWLNGFYCSRKRLPRDPGCPLECPATTSWTCTRSASSNQCPANTLLRHLSPAQSVGKALQSQVIYTWLWRASSLLRMKICVFNSVRTFSFLRIRSILLQYREKKMSWLLLASHAGVFLHGSSFFIPLPAVN